MTTYVKRASANCGIHYQSFQFSSHLQYNTLKLSPSRVFHNEWHSRYSNLVVINDSTRFLTEVHFEAKSCDLRHISFITVNPQFLYLQQHFVIPVYNFRLTKNANQKFNYTQSWKITRIGNLLSKNRLIHLKPIMTFLGKLFETYPKIRPINH